MIDGLELKRHKEHVAIIEIILSVRIERAYSKMVTITNGCPGTRNVIAVRVCTCDKGKPARDD